MSEEKQKWFVAERARALAMIHLTRRDDLMVMKAGQGLGLEFIVTVAKEGGGPSLRQFGVALRGTKSPVTVAHLDKVLRPAMQSFRGVGAFPYPVCLFHFTMDDDQGYYTWVAEPAVAGGEARLLMHQTAHCRILDRAALDEMVGQVDRWYDAFFGRIAVEAS